ncbi:uncharacterized protein LOC134668620 [Cydia fagiglandana]|uniref:uncharacterized protein LOC134668620 n=1 Tax=Cydia fagiglandana TaxID=1458189 RepID=UPI002FEE0DEE
MSWFDSVKDVAKSVAKNIAEATSSVTDSVDRYSFEPVTNVAKSVAKNIAEATSSVTDSVDRDSFETVKNVAKTVAKNITEATSPVTDSVDRYTLSYASAVPDHHSGWWSVLSNSTSGNHSEGSSESDSDSERLDVASGFTAVEVTTRARYTYELDRFQKNALLMFVQMKSEPPGSGCRVEETTTKDINVILDTLTGFRFEVNNTHIDLTCSEIENKCQEFFEQNFTEYGAVIVVVLTFDGTTGQLSALDGRLSESIILRHLTDNLNPTLLGKPKIYITEANRIISSENGLRLISISLEGHQDVLGFHIPTTMEHQSMIRRPLLLMCDNIKNMADNHDFATILKKSAEDIAAEPNFVFVDNPIEYCNNFTKEMILARS